MRKVWKLMAFAFIHVMFLGVLTACGGNGTDADGEGAAADDLFTAGAFTGTGEGYDGEMTLEVTFSEAEILEIEVLEHNDTPGFAENAFDEMIPNIVAAQSTDVDTVSGATLTSNGIVEAVNDAIRQAGADPASLEARVVEREIEEINTEADVIVVGGGMGGLTTAISSASNGASVILIEKLPILGGSTQFGGGISVADSSLQTDELGVSFEEFYENWRAIQADDPRGFEFYDEELIAPLVERSGEAFDFLLELGYQAEFHPGGRMLVSEAPEDWEGWRGPLFVEFLEETARDLGVEIHLETRGLTLVEENGRVTGIVAEGPSGEVTYSANNAVVLATGGFSRNQELMERFIPELAPFVDFSTVPVGHMGDGIVMAEEVGADIHEDQWLIGLGLTNEFAGMVMSVPGILVNQEGDRFVMETRPPGFIDHYNYLFNYAVNYAPEGSFFVFDSSEPFAMQVEQVEGNLDNDAAFKGETLEELAEAMGVPYENLRASVDLINGVAAGEQEDPLGRTVDIHPVTEGPFYAMRLYPFDMGTIGGVLVDEEYRVLNADGQVIQGLFAVGEMSNRRYIGSMYFSGLSLMVTLQQGVAVGEVVAE